MIAMANSSSTGGGGANPTMSPRMALSHTFQFAQKCFSFDNTLDEYHADDDDCYDDDDHALHHGDDNDNTASSSVRTRRKLLMPSTRHLTMRLTPRVSPLEPPSMSASSFGGYHFSSPNVTAAAGGGLRPSQSWDVGHTATTGRASSSQQDYDYDRQQVPFRNSSSTSWQHPSLRPWGAAAGANNRNQETMAMEVGDATTPHDLRGRINSDFSPSKISNMQASMELQTPQRIEIEREDALDILACLVERGIADWNTAPSISWSQHEKRHSKVEEDIVENKDADNDIKSDNANKTDKKKGSACPSPPSSEIMNTEKEEKSEDTTVSRANGDRDNFPSDSILFTMMDEFRKWSLDQVGQSDQNEGCAIERDHTQRMAVMEELVKSHAYALEMKRAAVSASTWLKSIGRGHAGNDYIDANSGQNDASNVTTTGAKSEGGQTSGEREAAIPGGEGSEKMELLTLKAMLHSAQMELVETKQSNLALNEELSKCRAEIGRIKSMSRNEVRQPILPLRLLP
jgi:hypothetical protein